MTADAGVPGFLRVEVIMQVEQYERLSAELALREMSAEIRELCGRLDRGLGWTEEAVKLGALLSAAAEAFAKENQ